MDQRHDGSSRSNGDSEAQPACLLPPDIGQGQGEIMEWGTCTCIDSVKKMIDEDEDR